MEESAGCLALLGWVPVCFAVITSGGDKGGLVAGARGGRAWMWVVIVIALEAALNAVLGLAVNAASALPRWPVLDVVRRHPWRWAGGLSLAVAGVAVLVWALAGWVEQRRKAVEAAEARERAAQEVQEAAQAAADRFGRRRAAYREALVARYSRLDLEILTPKEQDEHRTLLLRSVFVAQRVRAELPAVELPKDLLRRLVEAGELSASDLPEGVDAARLARVGEELRQQPARDALEVLADAGHRLVVVLGDPGAGKSTLARYLMLALAGEQPDAALAPLGGWLPVLVELRSYADPRWRDNTFLDFIDHLHAAVGLGLPKDMLDEYLRDDGRAVVVFDGLDELFDPELREGVTHEIAAFAARYPKARVVVTSRVIGYRRAILDAAGFGHYTIADLDRGQVERFVTRWYELACPDDAGEAASRRRRILDAVDASASLRELAGNPLLLTILSIIGRRQELPRDRRSVYAHAAAVLVEHWDVERHLRDARIPMDYIDREDKLELLQQVARRMQDSRPGLAGNHIAGADLLAVFDGYLRERYQLGPEKAKPVARAMLARFRERNFILSHFGAEVYGFVHRAFLEYFCAADIVSQFGQRRDWTPEQFVHDVYGQHWKDPAWQEVLLLVAGMVDARVAGHAIDCLLAADPLWFLTPGEPPGHVLLAARCLGEVRKLGLLGEQGLSILRAVVGVLEIVENDGSGSLDYTVSSLVAPVLVSVFTSVGPAWPNRDHLWWWYLTKGRRIAVSHSGGFAVELVAVLFAVELVAVLFADRQEVHGRIVADATFADPSLRQFAMRALAAGWGQDPDTLVLLRRAATNDKHSGVRIEAVRVLAAGWGQDPDTLVLLRRAATSDENWGVRSEAVRVLRGLGQDVR